jgi:hypothetical protein
MVGLLEDQESAAMGWRAFSAILALSTVSVEIRADHFDEHTLAILQKAATTSKKVASLQLVELAGAPKVVVGAPASTLLVVQTSDGDWCKLLVRPGGVKLGGRYRPALQIERMTTYSANPRRGVKADRKEVFLFEGFALDLDLGQIVPADSGEDLTFAPDSKSIEAKKPTDEATMSENPGMGPPRGTIRFAKGVAAYIPLEAPQAAKNRAVSAGGSGPIGPSDFVGKYKLDVDGKFTGTLEVKQADGKLTGAFRSDQTGNSYDAAVDIARPTHRVTMRVAFPRTDMELSGCLWTKERRRIAGLATMEDRTFGFVAERID